MESRGLPSDDGSEPVSNGYDPRHAGDPRHGNRPEPQPESEDVNAGWVQPEGGLPDPASLPTSSAWSGPPQRYAAQPYEPPSYEPSPYAPSPYTPGTRDPSAYVPAPYAQPTAPVPYAPAPYGAVPYS